MTGEAGQPGPMGDDPAVRALRPSVADPPEPRDPSPPARQDGVGARVTVHRGGFTLEAQVFARAGEVLAVLGPNGSGKTTLLRALAGLLAIDEGRIALVADHPLPDDGSPAPGAGGGDGGDGGSEPGIGDIWDEPASGRFVPAVERRVGLVFQDYRLFPHLSVLDNVAFAARAHGARRAAARRGAAGWLLRFDLAHLADRRPAALSGGQAQRVALARALASEPRLLLLDEPLAALDARTRLEIRSDLRHHLAGFPGPTLVVTHDPLEALVLADRILVLEEGRVVQDGAPALVARRPATEYVARLMGLNLYTGSLTDRATHRVDLDCGGTLYAAGHDPTDPGDAQVTSLSGSRLLVVVAPSAIALHTHQPDAGSPRNVWTGTVTGIELLTDRVRVAVEGRPSALVDVTPAAVAALALTTGRRVWLTAKATEVTAYPDPGRAPLVL